MIPKLYVTGNIASNQLNHENCMIDERNPNEVNRINLSNSNWRRDPRNISSDVEGCNSNCSRKESKRASLSLSTFLRRSRSIVTVCEIVSLMAFSREEVIIVVRIGCALKCAWYMNDRRRRRRHSTMNESTASIGRTSFIIRVAIVNCQFSDQNTVGRYHYYGIELFWRLPPECYLRLLKVPPVLFIKQHQTKQIPRAELFIHIAKSRCQVEAAKE